MNVEQDSYLQSALADDMVPESEESDIQILKIIHDSKFPVYLVYSTEADTHYALKTFPYTEKGQINPSYLNEARFTFLQHENLIPVIHTEESSESLYKGRITQVSCILMERAVCDFADLLEGGNFAENEKLARTYFHQLIDGIEYLHSQNIAHLDLKAENLLLGQDRLLKITDFDLSYREGDKKIRGKGTRNYRAPEIKEENCENPFLADIYSAGIILFSLIVGHLPYQENMIVNDLKLQELMFEEPEKFWDAHFDFCEGLLDINENFKKLFMAMVKKNPQERPSLAEIKKCRWYQGPIYSKKEIGLRLNRVEYAIKPIYSI